MEPQFYTYSQLYQALARHKTRLRIECQETGGPRRVRRVVRRVRRVVRCGPGMWMFQWKFGTGRGRFGNSCFTPYPATLADCLDRMMTYDAKHCPWLAGYALRVGGKVIRERRKPTAKKKAKKRAKKRAMRKP